MKFILTSSGIETPEAREQFLQLLPRAAGECSAIMIAYAQTEEEEFYVEASGRELRELGLGRIEVFNLNEDSCELNGEYDVVYVCGGNTFDILNRMRITGAEQFLRTCEKNKDTVYVGVSAGSIIAGPSIEAAGWGESSDMNDCGIEDLSGFGFVPFAVFPHYRDDQAAEIESFRGIVDYEIVPLRDGEYRLV